MIWTILFCVLMVVIYYWLGYFLLRVLHEADIVDYNWEYEPAMWFFGTFVWPFILMYWGIYIGFRRLNENYLDELAENIAQWLKNKFNIN